MSTIQEILSTLRKENVFNLSEMDIKEIFISFLNVNSLNYIETARNWFDSKLRDIDRESDKTESGKETNKSGKKMRIRELEIKYFKTTLKDFKENGYKITDK
jgi:hypothetical protein